jgi:lipid-A-disaccharide synthase
LKPGKAPLSPGFLFQSYLHGMKLYIIAGEASGDLHGSNLVRELKNRMPGLQVRCWGGDLMQAAGAAVVKHYRDLAFMGFTEVVKNLGTIMRNFKICKADILSYQPDAVVFIDYPGFNLRMAKWAKQNGFTTLYYISPQIWAWKEKRVLGIKKYVDQMLVILPFEKAFYEKWQYPVTYVGHPLAEVVQAAQNIVPVQPIDKKQFRHIIALLPGSRQQEILIKLPVMLAVSKRFKEGLFVVAKAPGQEDAFYEDLLKGYENVIAVRNQTYDLLMQADAALVTSGTATLETALFGVPQVVCYKGGNISYQIAKRLIKVKYISLVNLVMDKPVVKELIQHEMNETALTHELEALFEPANRQRILSDYGQLRAELNKGGHASANAAAEMLRLLSEKASGSI